MDRRELLGILGAGVAGLVALDGGNARADDEGDHDEHIKTIGACAKLCNEAAHHCLQHLSEGHGDLKHHARAHELTMDCQAFCVLTAALMARSSPLAGYAHQACADACHECAAECEKGQGEIMQQCARACRACEQVCRQMGKSSGGRTDATR
ncbi:MAG TPA: four-helix bundle copper-binding protein [Isosphaeraceae bacterium]